MTRNNILSVLVILGLSAQIMAQTCQVSVTANKRDYSYPDGQGHTNFIYDLVLTNTGSCVVNSIVLNIVPAITSDQFSSSWNLNQQTATRYEVVNFGSYLAPGSQFAGPGFILASSGSGAVTVTVNTQTCNTCAGSSSTTAASSTTTTTAAATTSSTTAATTTTSATTATTSTTAAATTTTTGTTSGSTTGSSSGCKANVFLTARQGSTWTESNGQISQIYDVTIQNTGSCNIDTIQIAVTIPSGASVTQRWNIDNNWFVNTYGSIPVNGAYLGAGFVLTGPGPNPSVATVAVQTINCANCGGSVTTTSSTTASATTTTGSSTTGGSTTTTTGTTGSSSGCNAQVSIAPRVGSSWTESNGQVSQIYDITTKNVGTCTLNNVRLNLIISSGSFVSQKWNLDAQYNVNLPNGGFLAPGASYGEAGIVLTGGGSVAVSVAAKACNSC